MMPNTHSLMNALSPTTALLAGVLVMNLTGCASVIDASVGMVSPKAADSIQHRRQSKELAAVQDSGDTVRAGELCDKGEDKNGAPLKKDVRESACGVYASLMAPQVAAMSCDEVAAAYDGLLRYDVTRELNTVSDARMAECKEIAAAKKAAEEEALAAKKAAEHKKMLEELLSGEDMVESEKICKDSNYASSREIPNDVRRSVCEHFAAHRAESIAAATCKDYKEVAGEVFIEFKELMGRDTIEDAWTQRALACNDWVGFFNDVVPTMTSERWYTSRSARLLERVADKDAEVLPRMLTAMVGKKGAIKKVEEGKKIMVAYTSYKLGSKHEDVGSCKMLGKLADKIGEDEGVGYVYELMIDRECGGFHARAEKYLASDNYGDRIWACHYLAKHGKRSSVKKMQKLSYTDSYVSDYEYPVRAACRDGYGKLELRLSK